MENSYYNWGGMWCGGKTSSRLLFLMRPSRVRINPSGHFFFALCPFHFSLCLFNCLNTVINGQSCCNKRQLLKLLLNQYSYCRCFQTMNVGHQIAEFVFTINVGKVQ